ncbi:hypothetical protein [Solimonas flava]|uniref:hypothetical protein n=1 Tax=Solimonas flava TaxID=415849 RepID=UPI001B7FA460|nr:hypothetical protein [Solimonas flava]
MAKQKNEGGAPVGAKSGILVGNLGEPIKLKDVNLAGISAEAAPKGGNVKIWTKLALTSDEPLFHQAAEGFAGVLAHHAQQAQVPLSLRHADTVLLVIKPDRTAEIWVDTAAMAMQMRVTRDMAAGSVVFESDIADVIGMSFPLVKIEKSDQVVCIFRQDWRFGMYFDFNPKRDLSLEEMSKTLGALYRELRYRHLYEALANKGVVERLTAAGWFPFVEIIGSGFKGLADSCAAGFDLVDEEAKLVAKFDAARIERMYERWVAKPHFGSRANILRAAVDAYLRNEPVPVLKIVLTEIEGILQEAYTVKHGTTTKLAGLLKFATESAEERAGAPDTLFFPHAFANYLSDYTFAKFDPLGPPGLAGSRHAVGHGAARADSYTVTRALQALLTMDQLAFYT